MSDASVRADLSDARQCLIRFWMAISAVWLTFWLLIGGVVLLTVEIPSAYSAELGSFALIVLAPPLALLAIGTIGTFASQRMADAFCPEAERSRRPTPDA